MPDHDGRAIANFVLKQCGECNRPITNLALQKIVYFCHVWSLIEMGRPLVKHEFEAWNYGPVLQYLYREFKDFDKAPITRLATALDFETGKKSIATCEFDAATTDLLVRATNFYSRLTASQLVELSHARGGPWDKTWNNGGKTNPGMKIKNEEILRFYSTVPHQFKIQ